MNDKVLDFIVKKQNITDNKCGTSEIYVRQTMDIDKETLRSILNDLYKQGLITIRKGVNGKLIFLNKKEIILQNTTK